MKARTNVSLEEDVMSKIDSMAKKERRNRSNMIEILVMEAIENRNSAGKNPDGAGIKNDN